MSDASSDNARNLAERVTEAGEAIGERVQSATVATAAAAGQAQKRVQDATAATPAAAGEAKNELSDAGEAAQQASGNGCGGLRLHPAVGEGCRRWRGTGSESAANSVRVQRQHRRLGDEVIAPGSVSGGTGSAVEPKRHTRKEGMPASETEILRA
jgi:hypothetical protein